jgi:hypothetical protein
MLRFVTPWYTILCAASCYTYATPLLHHCSSPRGSKVEPSCIQCIQCILLLWIDVYWIFHWLTDVKSAFPFLGWECWISNISWAAARFCLMKHCATKSVRVTLRAEKLLFDVVCPFDAHDAATRNAKSEGFHQFHLASLSIWSIWYFFREWWATGGNAAWVIMTTAVYFGSSELNGLWQCPASQNDRFVGICI